MNRTPSYLPLGLLVLAALCVGAAPAEAQSLRGAQVHVTGAYSHAFSFADGAETAGGPGVSMRVHAPLARGAGVTARFGLDRMGVEQQDPIQRWGWGYWEELWATWSEIYRSNPNMEGDFRPVQHALLLSGALAPSFSLGGDRHVLTAWAGPSLTYYTRRLYNEETWTRRYPSIEHSFSYTIRNYAPDKTGLALGLDAGLSGSYRLTSWISLGGGVSYRRLQVEATPALPLNDVVTLDFGFAVRY